MFLRGRWWRELEQAREVSRVASKHCRVSSCFQQSQVEEHERVSICETALSNEALLNRIDSGQYGAGRVAHSRGAILHKRD